MMGYRGRRVPSFVVQRRCTAKMLRRKRVEVWHCCAEAASLVAAKRPLVRHQDPTCQPMIAEETRSQFPKSIRVRPTHSISDESLSYIIA